MICDDLEHRKPNELFYSFDLDNTLPFLVLYFFENLQRKSNWLTVPSVLEVSLQAQQVVSPDVTRPKKPSNFKNDWT